MKIGIFVQSLLWDSVRILWLHWGGGRVFAKSRHFTVDLVTYSNALAQLYEGKTRGFHQIYENLRLKRKTKYVCVSTFSKLNYTQREITLI